MPPTAFDDTERQFLGLVAASAPNAATFRRYHLAGRSVENHATQPPEGYLSLEQLYESTPDAVIVTGGTPHPGPVEDEPSWNELAVLLEWAVSAARTVIVSCLAAHSALTLFDGLPRRSLPVKQTGVLRQDVRTRTRMTEGLPPHLPIPQSRYNEVPTDAVDSAGYQVLLASRESGWTLASKRIGGCDLVLMQGHPEYDASTLLLEYRRDVRRWLEGSTLDLPRLPIGCAAPADMRRLADYHAGILRGAPGVKPDFNGIAQRAPGPWLPHARRLYRNWVRIYSSKDTTRVA